MKPIVQNLQEVMKERGLKVPAVADLLGIPKDRIYKWIQENIAAQPFHA